MGNRALRKQVIKAMKDAGIPGKLYHGNKNVAHRGLRANCLKDMLYLLTLKPGTIVHDCDAFNHRVKGHLVYHVKWDGNTHVLRLDQLEFEDGRWSCGCPGGPMPPTSREDIEKYFLLTDEQVEEQKRLGWWSDRAQIMLDTIKSGNHICDEDGIKLKEFR